MSTTPNPAPAQGEITQDERTYAALAHALQVIGGWIAPLIIFIIQSKSKFVRFHALQALFLQLCLLVFWVIFAMFWFAIIFATVLQQIPQQAAHPSSPPLFLFFTFPLIWLVGMGLWVAIVVIAIIYAIRAGRGEWAEYPIIGEWVRRILHIDKPPTP
jgi:uncharacterized membrane protein